MPDMTPAEELASLRAKLAASKRMADPGGYKERIEMIEARIAELETQDSETKVE